MKEVGTLWMTRDEGEMAEEMAAYVAQSPQSSHDENGPGLCVQPGRRAPPPPAISIGGRKYDLMYAPALAKVDAPMFVPHPGHFSDPPYNGSPLMPTHPFPVVGST